MRKYFYFLLSVLMFTQLSFAKDDCDTLINEYFNKNYIYADGVKGKMKLDKQRNCLNMRNPLYSNAYDFEQKQNYLLSIDDNFLVRKNLIDYQEAAQVLAENDDVENSSRYIDKFNEILIQRFDKNLAAVILKEQVQSGLISKTHQEELFEKVNDFLPTIGKCHPGVCEGWGLVSLVADAFPKCEKNSCQRNILYENLYFALANSTNNYPRANKTIKTLLAKDFGTARSNGEVKTPLVLALSYTNPDDFIDYADNLLGEAKNKGLKYDYQDALLLPLTTELLLTLGQTDKLFSYAKAPPYNIANMEAALALLSKPIGDTIRENLRPNIEYYYKKSSACNEFSVSTAQGTETLQQSSPSKFTKDPELDLFLRQRLQYAYWSDGFGSMLEHQATSGLTCVPSRYAPEDIDKFLVTSRLVKNFVKENLIDDIILLPFFAFNKIKAVVKGARQAPKMIEVARYSDKVIDLAQTARRAEMEIDKALELSSTKIRKMPQEIPYRQAVGQDFMPSYIGDNNVLKIYNTHTSHGGGKDIYKWRRFSDNKTVEKYLYKKDLTPKQAFLENKDIVKPKKQSKKVLRSNSKRVVDELFYTDAPAWAQELGYDVSKKIANAVGAKNWYELKYFITDPEILYALKNSKPDVQKTIINKIEKLYTARKVKGYNNFKVEHIKPYGSIRYSKFKESNILLVHEVKSTPTYVTNVLGKPEIFHLENSFISKRGLFSPKTPQQTLDAYLKILGATPEKPAHAVFLTNWDAVRLYSNDGKKMIRIAKHEYSLSNGVPAYHFHYYELGDDWAINNIFYLDLSDPYSTITDMTTSEVRNLLLPRKEIFNSKSVIVLQ